MIYVYEGVFVPARLVYDLGSNYIRCIFLHQTQIQSQPFDLSQPMTSVIRKCDRKNLAHMQLR